MHWSLIVASMPSIIVSKMSPAPARIAFVDHHPLLFRARDAGVARGPMRHLMGGSNDNLAS
jgi:hypothetical protein